MLQYETVVVTGFIDLIGRDDKGRTVILDYKTGERPATDYALQLGIYRNAALRVYKSNDAVCAIGRFSESGFAIEELSVPPLPELNARVAAVAAGLLKRDTTARPGDWCWTCAYRAAPCDAYPRRKSGPGRDPGAPS